LKTRSSGSGKKKEKVKGSWRDTMATLRESPKIMNLALLVVCYALSHRLFEFAWKGQLRLLFPTTQAYSGALADVSIYTGARPSRNPSEHAHDAHLASKAHIAAARTMSL
jgi:ATP/ADP translocase